ncbi:phage portal protein [Acinetobacter nosocomialis]|uniref:phage portal protein n=1 Tax=Acinetobacter nosocomialis TaxID=106654 RepID=UPI0021BD3D0D|nr:phage portal protein [Acinetobacter nosocomialis]MCT9271137.1 phage portal protein [Acinetobacter baumannii]MDQ9029248.1 phage portal protein [Acinetobacter nosocomialis]MDQ9046522.1 phage portal protein [Acinetobacter nosocomialis]MDQ9083936.1 phage portal protein [Acinetobacter nosocomialis]
MNFWQSLAGFFGFAPVDPVKGSQNNVVMSQNTARPVTFNTAMTVGAVFAATRLIAETVSTLPLNMYQLNPDGSRFLVKNHPLIDLLSYRPNYRQTRIEFFETLMLNLVSDGNAYCYRGYGDVAKTRLVSLQVINSGSMNPILNDDGSMSYEWQKSSTEKVLLTDKDVWHIKLFGTGVKGLSPLQAASKSVGMALAASDRASDLMGKEAPAGGLFLKEGRFPKEDQRNTLRQEVKKMINGDEIPVFPDGMDFKELKMTPAELELITTMRYGLEDIARIYGVPSVLINDQSASTVWGSGIDSLIQASYKFNFRPYLEKIELSILINLLPKQDWKKYEFEFDFGALLRANEKDRTEINAKKIQTGQKTPNEIRLENGDEPKPFGDTLFVPANILPIDKSGQVKPTNNKEENI